MKNSFFRIRSLIYKEFCQIVRDKSTFLIGIILPMMLIVLIGSGMSLDVKNIPVAVVLEDSSPLARDSVSFLNGSEYFEPHYVTSMKEAEALVSSQQADSIIRIPSDFSADLYRGKASVQVILNGVNTTTATSAKGILPQDFCSGCSHMQKRQEPVLGLLGQKVVLPSSAASGLMMLIPARTCLYQDSSLSS